MGVQTGDHTRSKFEKINQIGDLDGHAIEHHIETTLITASVTHVLACRL
jgi:hypothetical protein